MMMATPDELQADIYRGEIAPNIRDGAAIVLNRLVRFLESRDVPSVSMVSVVASDPSASESGDAAALTFTRTGGDLNCPLTVQYHLTADTTAGTGDYAALSGTVVFPAGQDTAVIPVSAIDDAEVEPTELLGVELCTLPSYAANPSAYRASVSIADNDATPAAPKPVLMVIANQDFYYQEYGDTRAALIAAGVPVVVAAQTRTMSYPHPNSGQGSASGAVLPDLAIADADASDYSAIVFVGGWGSSSYQYAFEGTYYNAAYNGSPRAEAATNDLINDFVDQDKYVAGLCHGVTVLAWARVDGVSPIAGKRVSAYAGQAPGFRDANGPSSGPENTTRWHVESNGATMVPSRSVGNPNTAADDVIVDGRIITAENYDSASQFGQTVAAAVRG